MPLVLQIWHWSAHVTELQFDSGVAIVTLIATRRQFGCDIRQRLMNVTDFQMCHRFGKFDSEPNDTPYRRVQRQFVLVLYDNDWMNVSPICTCVTDLKMCHWFANVSLGKFDTDLHMSPIWKFDSELQTWQLIGECETALFASYANDWRMCHWFAK
jgi:hypothetical protein